jgi:hypothetical protein
MAYNKSMRKVLGVLLLAVGLRAQEVPTPTAQIQYFDNSGVVCSGCLLYTYAAGGTTPQNTYTSASGASANANPVVLDSAGRANVWTTPGLAYRFDLYTSGSVLLWSVDHIPGGTLAGSSTTTANYVFAGPASGSPATPGFRALVAADFAALSASCINQFLTSVTGCASPVLAGPQFANQGTTTTVAHGNASGNPSWGPSVGADFGSSITARSGLGNNTASAAAAGFGTTEDRLAYQVAEIPSFVRVATDFTTTSSTSLQTITGLSWTIPANTALNVPFICELTYNQATGNAAVAFGIQDVTVSPTNIGAQGYISTSSTAATNGVLVALASTTATAIVSATPGATGTDYAAEVSGLIEAPSNASSTSINIMVSTATAGDAVTVRRGSFCRLN